MKRNNFNYKLIILNILNYITLISSSSPSSCLLSSPSSDVINLISNTNVNTIWFESGFVVVDDMSWISIKTSWSSFQDAAIFVSVPSIEQQFPVSVRLRNVISKNQVKFDIRVYQANDSYCSKIWRVPTSIQSPLNVGWLVMELGVYNITTSTFMIGKGPINRQDNTVTNQNNLIRFTYPTGCGSSTTICSFGSGITPGIILQLQTLVYDRLLIPRVINVQRRFARIVLQPHDSNDPSYYVMLNPETLAYLAFITDTTIICKEGLTLETHMYSGVTNLNNIMSYNYIYQGIPGLFGVVGSSVSLSDSTSIRIFNRSSSSTNFILQEDQCIDEETSHTTPEIVYMMTLGKQTTKTSCIICQGIFTPQTSSPTISPTSLPTLSPTKLSPANMPHYLTKSPSLKPTFLPSITPSKVPTVSPTFLATPTRLPTVGLRAPSKSPSLFPTRSPTCFPSRIPTRNPTVVPTKLPTIRPSYFPSLSPTLLTKSPSRMNLPTTDYRCFVSDNNLCKLTDYVINKNIQIIPPTSAGCGCIDSNEQYSFVVTKGDPNNVLLYFQGGGICWDQNSYNTEECRTYTLSPPEIGLLDHTNNLNPFESYTTITVPYCTGDFFVGNSSDTYYDSLGKSVRYTGIKNVLFILNWLKNEQQFGEYLNKKLDKLILVGSSAGSIGVQLWSDKIINSIPAKYTAVIADSLFTFSPPEIEYIFWNKWNFCSSFLLPTNLLNQCEIQSQNNTISLSSTQSSSTILQKLKNVKNQRNSQDINNNKNRKNKNNKNFQKNKINIDPKNKKSKLRGSSLSSSTTVRKISTTSINSISTTISLRFVDIVTEIIRNNPQTLFLYVTSKRDRKAMSVYNDLSSSYGGDTVIEDEYYDIITQDYIQVYQSISETINNSNNSNTTMNITLPNIYLYFIESNNHIYLNRDVMYTTTQYDESELLLHPNLYQGTPLYEWLKIFSPNNQEKWNLSDLTSLCSGNDCNQILFPDIK